MNESTWSEADVEEWVCDDPERVWLVENSYTAIAGRQVTLGSGKRIDVLIASVDPDATPRVVVVGIKKGPVTTDALEQLLEYISEVTWGCGHDIRVSEVLVGRSASDKVHRIVDAIEHVQIVEYGVTFTSYPDGWPQCFSPPGSVVGRHRNGNRSIGESAAALLNDGFRGVFRRRARALTVLLSETPQRLRL